MMLSAGHSFNDFSPNNAPLYVLPTQKKVGSFPSINTYMHISDLTNCWNSGSFGMFTTYIQSPKNKTN